MAPGINVDPYGIIPTSSKTLDEQKKLGFGGNKITIPDSPASPFRKGLQKAGKTLLTGAGVGGASILDAVSTMVEQITGAPTKKFLPGNIEAFDKSLQSWNLGIGASTASTATTPTAASKTSLSQQAPAGITPPVVATPANETVAKPITAEASTTAPATVGGIKPYTPPPGWKTTLGMQDFAKYENPTEYRMGITRDLSDNKIVYDPQTNQPVPLIEARGIGALKKPVDETTKTLATIDKELTKPGVDRQGLLKLRGDIIGHKETAEAAKLAAQGIGAYRAGELDVKNKELNLSIEKFAKENDMKDPQNIIKLATSIAPKKTSYDASGATIIEPDVNTGLLILQKFGYKIGGLTPEKVDHFARAKAVLAKGAKREDVETLLKSKGYTDDQIKKGLGE
jgi:hypothetical protein